MWKEETPVSRLIDELVGKKSLKKRTKNYKGVCRPFLFFTTYGGGKY